MKKWVSLYVLGLLCMLSGCSLGGNTEASSRETAVESTQTTAMTENPDCSADWVWVKVDFTRVQWACEGEDCVYPTTGTSGMWVPTPWSVGTEKVSPWAGALTSFSSLSSALTWSNLCVGWNSSSFWIPSGSNGGCAHLEKVAE